MAILGGHIGIRPTTCLIHACPRPSQAHLWLLRLLLRLLLLLQAREARAGVKGVAQGLVVGIGRW